jgi:Uma2 family endonuclease
MSSPALVPVEEYLRYTEKPNCEYRDGIVYPKPLSDKFHSTVQCALVILLDAQGAQPLPELTVQISPTKYLVPDVTVANDFPGPYPTEPVQLCCEILSPEDRLGAMLAKCEEYHSWASPTVGSSTPSNVRPGSITHVGKRRVRSQSCGQVILQSVWKHYSPSLITIRSDKG